MFGYNILKELVEYHDCLKRKEENVGRKKKIGKQVTGEE